jgi:heat shock protein HslJ
MQRALRTYPVRELGGKIQVQIRGEMRTRTSLLVLSAWALWALRAHAQTPLQECYAISVDRQQVRACLEDKLRAADHALADAYRAMLTEAKRLDRATGRDQAAKAFESSQRAFHEYRDRTCQWISEMAAGGTGAGDMDRDCMIRLARRRTRDLTELMPGPAGGRTEATAERVAVSPIAETEWHLVKFEHDGQAREPLPDSKVTLQWQADGRPGGLASINRYFGAATFDAGGGLTWRGPLGGTRIAGPPELMEQEAAFLEALPRTTRWRTEEAELILESADGAVRLVFRR